jgi:3(or 17)beta-hydroxysteroid dehydrogenase
VGNPDLAAYCASKGAVRLLTKSIALHCAQNGYSIRCNSVHPSYIETPLVQAQIRHSSDSARARRQLEMVSPLRRLGTAEEVAAAIVFLASPAASFINGTELAVDGGTTAR